MKIYKDGEVQVLKKGDNATITIQDGDVTRDITISSSVFESISTGAQHKNLIHLGKGGFGSVDEYTSGDVRVCIKASNIVDGDSPKPAWLREHQHTKEIRHPNIIQYFGQPIIYNRYIFFVT